jgi:hypothetical protein
MEISRDREIEVDVNMFYVTVSGPYISLVLLFCSVTADPSAFGGAPVY